MPSTAVVISNIPLPPVIGLGIPMFGGAIISFILSAGATLYTLSAGGLSSTSTSSPISLYGLSTRTGYSFQLTASNAYGTSAASSIGIRTN